MKTYEYDVALSFSGSDRQVADELARCLEGLGVSIFYDSNEVSDLWGKDLYQHLQGVYRDRARYCVVIVSESYGRRNWPRHELQQAQARAFISDREYILPLRLDDSELPGINTTIGYVDLRRYSLNEVSLRLVAKIRGDDYAALVSDPPNWGGGMIEHVGAQVASFWPRKIEAAQVFRACAVTITLPRIPYGSEAIGWNASVPCHDCAVVCGQFHVPGCDVEECPSCGSQALGCGCDVEFIEGAGRLGLWQFSLFLGGPPGKAARVPQCRSQGFSRGVIRGALPIVQPNESGIADMELLIQQIRLVTGTRPTAQQWLSRDGSA